jgi:hypothetical protein
MITSILSYRLPKEILKVSGREQQPQHYHRGTETDLDPIALPDVLIAHAALIP